MRPIFGKGRWCESRARELASFSKEQVGQKRGLCCSSQFLAYSTNSDPCLIFDVPVVIFHMLCLASSLSSYAELLTSPSI